LIAFAHRPNAGEDSMNRGAIMGDVVRRIAFIGILIYIALDLSFASMPGAFVFEPADSVEGAQTSRLRATAEDGPSLSPVSEALASKPPVDDREVSLSLSIVRRPAIVAAAGHPTDAPLAPPPSSEDPL
jgi:hypothetical protein